MTIQLNLRNMTSALATHPTAGRTTDGPTASRWTRPVALAILAVAVLVGVLALRDSSRTHTPNTTHTTPRVAVSARHEPLIIADEKAFIDRLHTPVVPVASPVPIAATHVQPLIIPEEQAFIDGKYSTGRPVAIDWCVTHHPC